MPTAPISFDRSCLVVRARVRRYAAAMLSAGALAGIAVDAGACGALGAALGLSPAVAMAQAQPTTPTAAEVAASVQRFYDQISTLRTRFHQTYYSKATNTYQRSSGVVVFKKPGKMLWRYDAPNGKIIVSDGERVQYYEPPDESGPGQVTEVPIANSELPQALSFLTGQGRLEEQFAFRLVDPRTQGFAVPGGQVLELRPRRQTPAYERLLFFVRNGSAVVRVLIIDHLGNRNRFDFTATEFTNVNVSDREFQWRPPPGTRRVQR
jgi:outer membrane lipoprotein carrier protein